MVRDISSQGDISIVFGMTGQELAGVMESRSEERIAKLSADLGVTNAATAAFFEILGERQVPTNELVTKLVQIAMAYRSMQQRLDQLTSDDGEIESLKEQARREIAQKRYDKAEAILADAEDRLLSKLDAAEREVLRKGQDAADTRAVRAELQRVRLDYVGSLASWREASRLAVRYESDKSAEYLTQYGVTAAEASDWRAASAALTQAGEILRSENAPPEELIRISTHLAQAKNRLGQREEAAALFEDAVKFYRLSDDRPNLARTLNSLAAVLMDRRQFPAASKLVQEALSIGSVVLSQPHPDFAVWLNNLATIRFEQGRIDAGVRLLRLSIKIDRETIGLEHPQAVRHLANMGTMLLQAGRFDEAGPFLQKSIQHAITTFGASSSVAAKRLANYAILLLDNKLYSEAEPLFRDALENTASSDADVRQSLTLLRNALGRLLCETDRIDEALHYLKPAFDEACTWEGQLPARILISANYAKALWLSGEGDAAKSILEQAIQSIESNNLSAFPRMERVYLAFADVCSGPAPKRG
ncbi:tetratricopeptide repeat protein [Rhizobium terrae]|uniref:tetratricopeptide repeat protein n=1 Tax=Rhizobium terrae TaxID=2171756 RepID=UPI0013C34CF9|nr:tetratricopeptide repeat protein [Rhizobium terrae]